MVAYNSQGLLKQLAGKIAGAAPTAYNVPAATKSQYVSVQKVQYAPAPSAASNTYAASPEAYSSGQRSYSAVPNTYSANAAEYSSVPTYSQSSGAQSAVPVTYSSSPSRYSPLKSYSSAQSSPESLYSANPSSYSTNAGEYDDANSAYQQLSQKASYSSAAQQPQAVTYQSSPVEQQVNFIPSQAVYQSQKPAAQQHRYNVATAPQQFQPSHTYETAAQSEPQYVYSQQAPQRQYYSAAPQIKYARAGVTYAQ